MEEKIYRKIESSRKELLDFSLRNPLINFKHTKSKGVHIVNTNSSYVFDFIVNQKKSMEFVELKSEIKPTLPLLKKKELDDSVTSGNKLQTNESEKNLQKNY